MDRQNEIQFLKHNDQKVILDEGEFKLEHSYLKLGYKGASAEVSLRKAPFLRLQMAQKSLPDHLVFLVFDAFRTLKTQLDLFNDMKEQIRQKAPLLNDSQLFNETRKYAAFPDQESVPPHNSGGAIDLTLYDLEKNIPLDMGTDFDHPGKEAHIDFFLERDDTIHKNRMLLKKTMLDQGFVNYENEWWHYSLGDRIWANSFKSDWSYQSMEDNH